MKPHIWDWKRDACLACGRSRQEVVEHEIGCGGTVKYREWLRGLIWMREPVEPWSGHENA